jgi:hypothetical protein
MTNQPREWHRFLEFAVISLVMCYAAQGIGLAGSALLDVKVTESLQVTFLQVTYFLFSNRFLRS